MSRARGEPMRNLSARLDRVRRWYLTAIRTLVQVRRLLTTSAQINVAEKQINVAG